MKKHIKIAAIALGGLVALAPATNAQAITQTESYKLTTYVKEDVPQVWVQVVKTKGFKFVFVLKDENQYILYSEVLAKNKEAHTFRVDLQNLPKGTYYIETSDGNTPIRKVFRKEEVPIATKVLTQRVVAMN